MHDKKDNNKTNTFIQGLRPFSKSLPHGLKKLLKKGSYNFSNIVDNWAKMVGKDLSNACYPSTVKMGKEMSNGTLVLNVIHGNELTVEYSKQEIMDKINSFFGFNCDSSSQSNSNSKSLVTIKVFSSLTCPHCADFHGQIYEKLEKEYISLGKVKFEHVSFPLDIAALNAEKILQCNNNSKTNFQFLTAIYKKQNKWSAESDIDAINSSIKEIGKKFELTDDSMNKCLSNKDLEEKILNERINAQKNYKISSTPTIYINEKKYEGKRDYKSLKKALDKIL